MTVIYKCPSCWNEERTEGKNPNMNKQCGACGKRTRIAWNSEPSPVDDGEA